MSREVSPDLEGVADLRQKLFQPAQECGARSPRDVHAARIFLVAETKNAQAIGDCPRRVLNRHFIFSALGLSEVKRGDSRGKFK